MFELIAGRQVFVPNIFQGFQGIPEAQVYQLCADIAERRRERHLAELQRTARYTAHGRNQATALRAQDDPKNDYVIVSGDKVMSSSIGLYRLMHGARLILHTPTGTFYTEPWCGKVRFVAAQGVA